MGEYELPGVLQQFVVKCEMKQLLLIYVLQMLLMMPNMSNGNVMLDNVNTDANLNIQPEQNEDYNNHHSSTKAGINVLPSVVSPTSHPVLHSTPPGGTDNQNKKGEDTYGTRWRNFSKAGAGIWIGLSLLCIIVCLVIIGAILTLFSSQHFKECFTLTSPHMRHIRPDDTDSRSDFDSNSTEIEDLASDPPLYCDVVKGGDSVCRLTFENIPDSPEPLVSDLTTCSTESTTRLFGDNSFRAATESNTRLFGKNYFRAANVSSHKTERVNSSIFSCSLPPSYQQVVHGHTDICSNIDDCTVPPPSYTDLDHQLILQQDT